MKDSKNAPKASIDMVVKKMNLAILTIPPTDGADIASFIVNRSRRPICFFVKATANMPSVINPIPPICMSNNIIS